MYELIANTPVEDGLSKCFHAVLYKGSAAEATDEDRAAQKEAQAGALEAFGADFNVWQNKQPALKIMQLKSDGPFNRNRKWYSQFYAARDGVAAIRDEVNGIVPTLGMATPADANHSIDEGLPI